MKYSIFTAISLFGIFSLHHTTQAQKRIYVNEYLNIGVGGRGLAMGGSQAAVTNDAMSSYWNPAGLVGIEDNLQAAFMHAEYFSGISKYDFANIVKPLKDGKSAIGFSFLRFAVDDIPNTIDYVQGDGSVDESKLTSMTAGDYAGIISYAKGIKIFKNPAISTNFGVNAKFIYRHLGSIAKAWGGGVDIGFQAVTEKWRIGIMAKDITTTYTSWTFDLSEREKQVFGATGNLIPVKSYEVMYPRINIGIARHLLKQGKKLSLLVSVDADITTDGIRNTLVSYNDFSMDPHCGLELGYKNTVYLRGGLSGFQRVLDDTDTTNQKKYTLFQPAAGVGLVLGNFNLDYAFTSLRTQNNPLYTHIISVRLNLKKVIKNKEEDITEEK